MTQERAMRAVELQLAIEPSSLGLVLVAGGDAGICAVLLGDDAASLRRDLERRFPRAILREADAAFQLQVSTVVAYVEDRERTLDLPLDFRGTPFQRQVWEALRQIPAGATASYRDLAEKVGRPQAVRAVGQAVAANPFAVIVPCHRAIRSDGSLSGYRWGVERKRLLLAREEALSGKRG
jgi:AraC family transcriptional regulator of adaptative response/methylated-DNA-[protein]-cysteine methyltransferase